MAEDGANYCYNYGKSDHYERDCRLPKRVEENTKLVIEEEKVDGIVMMAYEEVVEEEVLIAYVVTKIRVDMDVDENMMENKEHGDDEDLLEAEKMNKCWKHEKCRSLPSCNSLSS
ncbi:hypothetical protein Tco_0577578 [Tanacetum coccineum]